METKQAREHYETEAEYAVLREENKRLRALLERALEQSARVHPDFAEKIRAALKVTK
jgi:hypothetical protein